jgi:CelD/BcsL family acetyltransferase involved in cellulose biosynthesis
MSYTAVREDFWALQPEWDALVDQGHTIFATPTWHRLWWREFDGERELALVAVRESERLVGVAPFWWVDGTLSLIGAEDLWDRQDLIFAPDVAVEAYAALLDAVERWPWRVLQLPAVPASSQTRSRFLPHAEARGYRVQERAIEVCPQVVLPDDWEQYLRGLSRKDRHELRRKMRRLEQEAKAQVELVTGEALTDEDIGEFFRLHRLSKPEKAQFLTPERARFLAAVLKAFAPSGKAKLFFLRLDGRRVAAALCFDTGEEYLLYNSGYDPGYAAYSVGLLLKAFCLRHALEQGRKRFDFLRGAEPYKYDLGGKDVPLYRYELFRPDELGKK